MQETSGCPDRAELDRIVREGLEAWGVPGVGVAVVHGDEEFYVGGRGVKDLATGEPVTAETLFGIASTTKAFTTTALAMLVDEGKLAWDDPVRKHLPWFRLADPLADAQVTVRDLVTHRTGMARNDMLWYKSPWSREEIVRRIGYVQPTAQLRARYQYNNIMFMAAGLVVGAVTGGTWEKFVRARIFEPLEMHGANFRSEEAERAPDHASPHRKNDAGELAPIPWLELDAEGPGGSINAGAADLARWMRFQLGGGTFQGRQLVSARALRETHAPQIVIRPDGELDELTLAYSETTQQSYAMGWSVWDYRGQKVLSHGGAIDGFRSTVCLVPALKLGLAILVNRGPTRMHEALRNRLLDRLLGLPSKDWNALLLDLQARAEAQELARKEEREGKRYIGTRPSRALEAYAGVYRDAAYGEAEAVVENGALVLRWSSFRFPLEHWHYDTFAANDREAGVETQVTFSLNGDGSVEALKLFEAELRRSRG